MPGNMDPSLANPGPSQGARRREERKKEKSHKRIERHIELVRKSNLILLEEMRASRYENFDVTEEDVESNNAKFRTWGSYHNLRTYLTAALLTRGDPAFVKDLVEVALTPTPGEPDHAPISVKMNIKSGSTNFSMITLERKPDGNMAVTCAAAKERDRKDCLFYLGQHPAVRDSTNQTRWGLSGQYWKVLGLTKGQVVENGDELVSNDSSDHPSQEFSLRRKTHSRYCDLVHSVERGSLALQLIMERDQEISTQVEVLANVQECDCLHLFRTGTPARTQVSIALTLGFSHETVWTQKPWLRKYLLAETWDRPSSWWIRLFAYYSMLTKCSTWEEDPFRLKVKLGDPKFSDED